ncbi:MAG: hypothetical protein D6714_15960 [Bacteroidetes bacterium]|nr:MAG: hypothetical protein D6714_15960 [Bacteroidota bacterium]
MTSFHMEKLRTLLFLKLKFALTSSVATVVDYGLFNVFAYLVFPTLAERTTYAHILSFSIAVIVNFYLQRRFIFETRRPTNKVFLYALLVSLSGLVLSTILIHYLDQIPALAPYPFLTKFIVTGVFFFYNFYLKRYAFEKRFV